MNYSVDLITIGSIITTGCAIIGFVYTFFRNFKQEINSKIDKLEISIEKRIDALDERMFYLSSGKTIQEALLYQKIKKNMDESGEASQILKMLMETGKK